MPAAEVAIEAQALGKRYGKVEALRGLSLRVARGTILVLLGPNGAGKTTLVRILSTLLQPDEGTAQVAGHDVVRDATRIRRVIGLAGQATAIDEHLTGRENLELVARFYHLDRAEARRRAAELLRLVDLETAAERPTKGYSGGMRRRLDLAATLIGAPEVIFLDEPTTGLDPPSRIALWKTIDGLRREGRTILLTTQNLEEADRLADRIAVVAQGRIIAEGTSRELKAKVGGDVIEVTAHEPGLGARIAKRLARLRPKHEARTGRVTVPAPDGARSLARVVAALDDELLAEADVALRRPTLDDVFLALTGHTTETREASA